MNEPARLAEEEAASLWVARMDGGAWSEADEAELQRWLAQDPRRHGLLLRTHALWQVPHIEPQAVALEEDAPLDIRTPGWRRRGVLGGLLAASAAGIVGALLFPGRGVGYVTKVGEIRRVPLVDGSVMTINSGTELQVRIAKRAREVELAQGEAWFEVAKDAARPFVVASGKVRAKAIGTAFSVRKRDNGVEVLVTEGVVETWSDGEEAQRVRLSAGQCALINDHAIVHYETDKPLSVDRALAWRSGMIDLDGTTLADAADEFNRYNDRQIVIADPDAAGERFDGLFRINDPEGFAEAVRNALDLTVNTSDPRFIRIQRGTKPQTL
ncbi:FecR family protein [Sphingomonas sp. NFR04]|uniref:FecR family protein n=1 Tax=Sphingomonas sp. NFR04 TaxID=1566283 RepID=UPI0008EE5D24|nr:FecR domain-containing protein [Sphingomonas sp. NFR04]SFK40063.1 FecR family protein [Sphingomonas sp. NFR04]